MAKRTKLHKRYLFFEKFCACMHNLKVQLECMLINKNETWLNQSLYWLNISYLFVSMQDNIAQGSHVMKKNDHVLQILGKLEPKPISMTEQC